MLNRKFLYVFSTPNNTTVAVNYDATNNNLNTFLSYFDVWGSNGEFKMSRDGQNQEVWFECSKKFLEFTRTHDFKRIFKNFGVTLVYKYPFRD